MTEKSLCTYKVNELGHFDLRENATSGVIPECRGVPNGESIRPLDRDFARFTTIQLCHSLHFCKCNKVAIFQSMSGFIHTGYEAFVVLGVMSKFGAAGKNIFFTFETDTIIPVSGCSPVGSTHANLGPKSLKTDLYSC